MSRVAGILGLLAACVVAALSYPLPDLDIRILGIGNHRYFLFHSAIFPLLVARLVRGAGVGRAAMVANLLVGGFALGICVHLLVDVFQSKSVVFPFVGTLVRGTSLDDRLWEGANGIAAGFLGLRRLLHLGARRL